MHDIHSVKYQHALRTPTDNEECKRKEIDHRFTVYLIQMFWFERKYRLWYQVVQTRGTALVVSLSIWFIYNCHIARCVSRLELIVAFEILCFILFSSHVVFHLSYFKTQFHRQITLRTEISHVPTKIESCDYVHDSRTQSRYTVHCFLNTVHRVLNCVHCILNYIYCVLN